MSRQAREHLSGLSTERAYWVAWSQIDGIGPILQKRIFEQFGSLARAWDAPADELLAVEGIGLLLADQITGVRSQLSPDEILQQYENQSQSFWTPADADYPSLLFQIPDPPPVLFYRGPFRPNRRPVSVWHSLAVGMVGTRHPSPYGVRWTRKLSSCLSEHGITIVSGMAKGVDTYAHESCLRQQGNTIAVLGTGANVVYPQTNQKLYERIAQQGLILSEYPDGTPPDRAHFPRRNRIIAGLSQAVLVTEAPKRSGALITAHLANDYGREVYALPSSLENPNGEGCLALINQGVQMILGEPSLLDNLQHLANAQTYRLDSVPQSARQSINTATPEAVSNQTASVHGPDAPEQIQSMPSLPLTQSADSPVSIGSDTLDPALNQIFQAIPVDPITLDNLVVQTQQETSILLSSLMQLELLGFITQLPGMQYQRNVS